MFLTTVWCVFPKQLLFKVYKIQLVQEFKLYHTFISNKQIRVFLKADMKQNNLS